MRAAETATRSAVPLPPLPALPMDERTAHTPPKETQPSLDLRTSTILLTLQRVLLEALDFEEVVRRIVNQLLMEPYFHERGYRIIVLNLVDEERAVLKRISLSSTPEAENAQKASAVPFHQIEIPLSAQDNLLIRCLTTQQPQLTHTWPELFVPVLTPEQALRNQTAAGIKTSLVYPVVVQGNAIGALIFGLIVATTPCCSSHV